MSSIEDLLSFIGHGESRGDYNIVWAGIKKADRPTKPLVDMTIEEVLAWQDSIDARYMSEAAGKYQILEDTLRGIYKRAGFTGQEKFNPAAQDALALVLLRDAGLTRYLDGEISAEKFCNAVARVWASLPRVSPADVKGRGWYDGDGLNKATAEADRFLAIVRGLRRPSQPSPLPKPANPIEALLHAIFGVLGRILKSITGKGGKT